MESITEKTNGVPSAVESTGNTNNIVPQEDLKFCAHRGHGCISQNGYRCTNGPVCQPMDAQGRRFVVFDWIRDGQPLATRYYLTDGEPKGVRV